MDPRPLVLLAPDDRTPTATYTITAVVITIVLLLTTISHLRKNRSLQDTLARTWLVPK